jgi:hypothetical protein
MIDEDAFGILFSYCDVEEDEYGSDDRAEFIDRFENFERQVLAMVGDLARPLDHHIVCLGHAVYAELRDDGETPDLLGRLRAASARLLREGFENVAILTHGSRWVLEGVGVALEVVEHPPRVVRVSRPSEPLRRALEADAFARHDEAGEGWGPGVYVDTEALEALGKRPKNAPTVLRARGGEFYRVPALRAEVT